MPQISYAYFSWLNRSYNANIYYTYKEIPPYFMSYMDFFWDKFFATLLVFVYTITFTLIPLLFGVAGQLLLDQNPFDYLYVALQGGDIYLLASALLVPVIYILFDRKKKTHAVRGFAFFASLILWFLVSVGYAFLFGANSNGEETPVTNFLVKSSLYGLIASAGFLFYAQFIESSSRPLPDDFPRRGVDRLSRKLSNEH